MIYTHTLDPVIFSLGSLSVHWYGLAYAAALLCMWGYVVRCCGFSKAHADTLFIVATAAIVLGGRLGYAVFYQPSLFSSWELFALWQGGMSFHGGLLGAVAAIYISSRLLPFSFFTIANAIAVPASFGLFLGRIANFINAELPGRVSGEHFGVIFPNFDVLPRHPQQLYAAILFLCLSAVLLRTPMRFRAATFLCAAAAIRFFVEFFREPLDGYIGLFTVGQWLSVPVMLVGLMCFYVAPSRAA